MNANVNANRDQMTQVTNPNFARFVAHLKEAEQADIWAGYIGEMTPYVVEVTFTKLDGTERVMQCILGFDSKIQDDRAIVWDVEAEGYRTVRADSVNTSCLLEYVRRW